MHEHTISISFNLISAPFGFAALYYGYRGYMKTRGGLRAFPYFLLAMVGLGATMLFDLLRLLNISDETFLLELGTLIVAVFFMLAFKDLDDFLSENL